MGYPPNQVFSAFSFIGFIVCLLPMRWHLQAYNVGTCGFMFWTGLGCLNFFINSIIWHENAILVAAPWCDISVRIIVALNVALPLSVLTINRRLYFIATSDTVVSSQKDRKRSLWFDIFVVFGLPLIQMVLAYIPQGNRFNLFENIGCVFASHNTPVAIVIYNVPPVIIGMISAVYCVQSIRAFNRRRLQFKQILSRHSNLSSSRYFRLMLLAGVDLLIQIPLTVWVLVINVRNVQPWVSWEDTHSNFSRIGQFPAILWQIQDSAFGLELQRWIPVAGALVFFLVLGVHAEARKNYGTAFTLLASKLGSTAIFGGSTSKGSTMGSQSRGNILPLFRKDMRSKGTMSDTSISQSGDMKKSFPGNTSFGQLSFSDAGEVLDEKNIEAASTIDASSTFPPDLVESRLSIEISSIHRGSMIDSICPPPPRTLDIMNVPQDHAPKGTAV